MEYARRRKRKRRNSSGAGRALGALVMVGLIIYLFTASAAGKWLAEEVMAPAFSALSELPVFNADGLDKLEQESTANEESLEVSLNGGISSVSENVEGKIYALIVKRICENQNVLCVNCIVVSCYPDKARRRVLGNIKLI